MPGRGRRSRRSLHAPATIYHALDRARQRHPGRITLDDIVLMERRTGRSMLMPRDGRSAFLDDIVGLQTPATKEGV